MTHQEKRAWIVLVTSVVSYSVYVVIIASRAATGRSLAAVPYATVLLWAVGASILCSIAAEIAMSVANPRESRIKDVRDRQIGQLGDYTGQSFVIIGAVAGMLMAMAGWSRFWIANVIYLGFTLSAIVGSITKIVVYRRSFPQW